MLLCYHIFDLSFEIILQLLHWMHVKNASHFFTFRPATGTLLLAVSYWLPTKFHVRCEIFCLLYPKYTYYIKTIKTFILFRYSTNTAIFQPKFTKSRKCTVNFHQTKWKQNWQISTVFTRLPSTGILQFFKTTISQRHYCQQKSTMVWLNTTNVHPGTRGK